jgi:hypothetical protein
VNIALSRKLGCGEFLVSLYEFVCEFVNLVLVPTTKLNAFLVYFSQLRGVKVGIFLSMPNHSSLLETFIVLF